MSKPVVYVLSRLPNLAQQLRGALEQRASVVEVVAKFTVCGEELQLKRDVLQRLQTVEILVTDAHILKNMIYQLPKMKWVQLTSAGVDNILSSLDKTQPNPDYVVARATCFGIPMAEYVVAGIINFERGLYKFFVNQQNKEWSCEPISLNFRTMPDLTIGILGAGVIGNEIACELSRFGAKVHGLASRTRSAEELSRSSFQKITNSITDLLTSCDYIVNALPGTPNTDGLLDNRVLSQCKKRPVFINVGRGNVVRNESIIEALDNGWISGAILDVFEDEPLPPESPLWTKENVIVTPHMSGPSRPHEIVKTFMPNFELYLKGEPLLHTFSFSKYY